MPEVLVELIVCGDSAGCQPLSFTDGVPVKVQFMFNSVLGNRAEVIFADPYVSVTLEKLSPAFKRFVRVCHAAISPAGDIFHVIICKGELIMTMQLIRSAAMALLVCLSNGLN